MGISGIPAIPMIITCLLQGILCDMGILRTFYGGKICSVLTYFLLMNYQLCRTCDSTNSKRTSDDWQGPGYYRSVFSMKLTDSPDSDFKLKNNKKVYIYIMQLFSYNTFLEKK
jgi:hypothetical protein